MKKILFVINTLNGGGAEKVLVDLLNNLDKKYYVIDLFLFDKQGIYLKSLSREIRVLSSYTNKNKWMECIAAHVLCRINNRFTRKLFLRYNKDFTHEFIKRANAEELYKCFIGNRKYDIEVAFLEGIATKLIAGSKRKGAKKIAWVHTDLVKHGWFKRYFISEQEIQECYNKFDEVVCVSEEIKNVFEATYRKKATVKWNPIDSKLIKSKSWEETDLLLDRKSFYYVAVGRFTKEKGFERLLNVHVRLIEEGYNVQLWIIGNGELFKSIAGVIKNENLNNSVKLLGFQENPYKYMKNADLYVCSSYVEGLSTTVLEALILGVPVVTTDCPGMNGLLENSKYGFITENSEQGLYNGIKIMLDDKKLYLQYREYAKIRGRQFDITKSMADIEELFEGKN